MAQRRALSIGIAQFDQHDQLDFAPGLTRDLAAVLADLGYDVQHPDSPSMSSERLGALVNVALHAGASDDVTIVHVVSHGEGAEGGATVFALGSDGVRHGEASMAHWLTMHQDGNGPTALFLLDLCSAGTAARLSWQAHLEHPKGFVIAASAPGGVAYDGRFTQAATNVLRALRDQELDIDPSLPHVPLATVARAIRREVNRLFVVEDSEPQQVIGSLVDITADTEPTFFPNPAYSPSQRSTLRAGVDPGVLPFLDDLDEGLDARHFIDRATGVGGLADGDTTGGMVSCFTGRDRELKRISPWLNGDGADTLCVVTGSPGAGKSALLGVLVCAANPDLRAATRPIWDAVAQAPLAIDRLAGVHARQRDSAAVAASIARQLSLPENLTGEDLVAAVRKGTRQAVVVVDALDEAADPVRIMTEQLLPLAEAGAEGTPARVLVGVRPYEQFTLLTERAFVVDLDEVDEEVLENDLYNYVTNLLRTTRTYRRLGGVVGAFAHAVASSLATVDEGGRRPWGPFLVAGLYTRHFVSAHAGDDAVTSPDVADKVGAEVPGDLPGVLELDLELRQDQPWLRPVLIALAYARGAGMPVSLLVRVAPVFMSGDLTPSVAEIRAALTAGKFYVRQSLDTDHSNLYRLFHQGLADALLENRPDSDKTRLLDAMLAPLGPVSGPDWDAAEPYLLRHIVDHATGTDSTSRIHDDPGLWLHPRFREILEAVPENSELAVMAKRFADVTSPAELALAAARAGQSRLARRAAALPGHAALTWHPRWTFGAPGPVRVAENPVLPETSRCVAISADGSRVLGIGEGGLLSWTWSESGEPTSGPTDPTVTGDLVALLPHQTEILVSEGTGLHWWHHNEWSSQTVSGTAVAAVAVTADPARLAVTVDGEILRLLGDGAVVTVQRTGFHGETWAVGGTGASVVAAFVNTRGQILVSTHGKVDRYSTPRPTTVVALSQDGRRLAAGTANGWLGTLELGQHDAWNHKNHFDSAVTALAFSPDGDLLAACSEDGTLRVVQSGEVLWTSRPCTVPITSVAISGSPVRVVMADEAGKAYYATENRAGALRSAHGGDEDTSLITAFEPAGEVVLIGWNEGSFGQLRLATGELVGSQHSMGGTIRDIVSLAVGGRKAWLVATRDGYQLHSADAEPVRLSTSSTWAMDQTRQQSTHVIWNGKLIGARVEAEEVTSSGSTLGRHPQATIVHCAYLNDRPTAFTGGEDGTVRVWDLTEDRRHETLHIGRPVWKLAATDDGWLLVGAGGELLAFQHVSQAHNQFLDQLRRGEVRKGVVSSIVNFGAFVDLGGVDGLVHVSELSWKHIDHPSEVVEVGQEVTVEVLDVDMERERVSLSLKATQEDPWRHLTMGQFVLGKVTKLTPHGAYVELHEDIEGVIPLHGLADEHDPKTPEQILRVGDDLVLQLIGIDLERRRIFLSLKEANEGFPADTEFDPTQYGMAAEYDIEGKYIYPEGFDTDTQEWQDGFDAQREEWERQYAEAHQRYEQHMAQIRRAGAAKAYRSAGADGQRRLQALASDEQLAALREKLAGDQ